MAIQHESLTATGVDENGGDPLTLVLSGGGFRATLFHLGVVRYISECPGLLQRVRLIVSVSGGSVLAAHLLLRWSEYLGGAASFDRVAKEIVHLVQSDLRGKIQRRYLASWCFFGLPRLLFWNGTQKLCAFLRQFLGEDHFTAVYPPSAQATSGARGYPGSGGRPEVAFVCTNLTTAEQAWFSSAGFHPHRECGHDMLCNEARDLPIADAVAASAAFPPVFRPYAFIGAKFGLKNLKTLQLTDGGVLDNTGVSVVEKIQDFHSLPHGQCIVSDAGAMVEDSNADFSGAVSLSLRAVEIVTYHATRTAIAGQQSATCKIISIADEVPEAGQLTFSAQNNLRRIRTDLDAFNEYEIYGLVQLGYLAAHKALQINAAGTPWAPVSPQFTDCTLQDHTASSSKPGFFRSLFAFRTDCVGSLLLLAALTVPLVSAVFLGLVMASKWIPSTTSSDIETKLLTPDEEEAWQELFGGHRGLRKTLQIKGGLRCEGATAALARIFGYSCARKDFQMRFRTHGSARAVVFLKKMGQDYISLKVVSIDGFHYVLVPAGFCGDQLQVTWLDADGRPVPDILESLEILP